jgi:hypothetical protein
MSPENTAPLSILRHHRGWAPAVHGKRLNAIAANTVAGARINGVFMGLPLSSGWTGHIRRSSLLPDSAGESRQRRFCLLLSFFCRLFPSMNRSAELRFGTVPLAKDNRRAGGRKPG